MKPISHNCICILCAYSSDMQNYKTLPLLQLSSPSSCMYFLTFNWFLMIQYPINSHSHTLTECLRPGSECWWVKLSKLTHTCMEAWSLSPVPLNPLTLSISYTLSPSIFLSTLSVSIFLSINLAVSLSHSFCLSYNTLFPFISFYHSLTPFVFLLLLSFYLSNILLPLNVCLYFCLLFILSFFLYYPHTIFKLNQFQTRLLCHVCHDVRYLFSFVRLHMSFNLF